ncbi:lytic transglycosylase F [Halioglobus sp. HI00S01]|uniref:transglycosylase SLT domain-containing protein n=1 Tax=Halioglobus sp. HI00S01 TaxID=1822214 RepID=UPI0007C3A48C|nr:transporter substrate-binding domain-containing protein [Halioglobus sp. HI00S01]KZX60442.1 lytic transglycosylase F [Halioglobus sp. HI00S01]
MKYLTRLLYLTCLISLAACGDNAPESAESPPEQVQTEPSLPAEPVETEEQPLPFAPSAEEQAQHALNGLKDPWTGDLDTMEEHRTVRVLTVYSPGRYYLEENGQEKGLVKEISSMFETFLNKRLQRKTVKVHVVIIPMARNQLVPALLAGHGDIINASLSITPERQQQFDFSIPASRDVSEILITGPTAPALASIDDLAGQTLYVRQSSSYRESIETLNERLLAEGKAPVRTELVSEFLEDDDLIEMVDKGLLPWAIVDSYKPTLWKGVFTNTTVRDDILFREGGKIAWAFRKDSPQLAAVVNDFLKKNREGTLVGNVLKNRYIRDFDWAANALDDSDYQRFLELQHIFQKYGEQYEVDYLLAAAQGYQESRLDQSARSHAGAVGVMQLLPTTASDKNVGIHDISTADANIHAGIKYLDFLRDRYFNDPAIDTRNKSLLALAAYNAGPSRMINLRRKAEQLGYDPNVWFDNVELVAAREVGREPVQYVANIYKYYVAYRFSIDQQAGHAKARQRAGMTPYRSSNEG